MSDRTIQDLFDELHRRYGWTSVSRFSPAMSKDLVYTATTIGGNHVELTVTAEDQLKAATLGGDPFDLALDAIARAFERTKAATASTHDMLRRGFDTEMSRWNSEITDGGNTGYKREILGRFVEFCPGVFYEVGKEPLRCELDEGHDGKCKAGTRRWPNPAGEV